MNLLQAPKMNLMDRNQMFARSAKSRFPLKE